MSVAETESTIRDYLGRLVDRGDFASLFSDDVLWITMETGDEVRGRDQVRDYIAALHSGLFDASPELVNVAFGDGVAMLEALFVGTQTAEFAGIPVTGASVRLPYAMSYDVSDGKINTLRAYFPITALTQQLKEAAAAAG